MAYKYPLIIVEIPHTRNPIVYEIDDLDHLESVVDELGYMEESRDEDDLLEFLTNDNHASLILSVSEAKDFAFSPSQDIYSGHQMHKAIAETAKYLKGAYYF